MTPWLNVNKRLAGRARGGAGDAAAAADASDLPPGGVAFTKRTVRRTEAAARGAAVAPELLEAADSSTRNALPEAGDEQSKRQTAGTRGAHRQGFHDCVFSGPRAKCVTAAVFRVLSVPHVTGSSRRGATLPVRVAPHLYWNYLASIKKSGSRVNAQHELVLFCDSLGQSVWITTNCHFLLSLSKVCVSYMLYLLLLLFGLWSYCAALCFWSQSGTLQQTRIKSSSDWLSFVLFFSGRASAASQLIHWGGLSHQPEEMSSGKK